MYVAFAECRLTYIYLTIFEHLLLFSYRTWTWLVLSHLKVFRYSHWRITGKKNRLNLYSEILKYFQNVTKNWTAYYSGMHVSEYKMRKKFWSLIQPRFKFTDHWFKIFDHWFKIIYHWSYVQNYSSLILNQFTSSLELIIKWIYKPDHCYVEP